MNLRIEDVLKNNVVIGQKFENDFFKVFFGNKNFSDLKSLEPYNVLKQVHGNNCVEALSPAYKIQEADAHFTKLPNLHLVVETADCLPIFIINQSFSKILAIHAGWRGVENKITPRSVEHVFAKNDSLLIFVGPHIQQNSFEVDEDVKNKLLHQYSSSSDLFKFAGEKYFIDLKNIIKKDLSNFDIKFFFASSLDTKTNLEYCSFRRDKKGCGRNFSYILKKTIQEK